MAIVNSDGSALINGHTAIDGLHISVSSDVSPLREEWLSLEKSGFTSLFQTYLWCNSWQATSNSADAPAVKVVIGRMPGGTVRFILPFQLRRVTGLNFLEWLTSPLASYGYGLFDSWSISEAGADWFTRNFTAVIDMIGDVHVISLRDIPGQLHSKSHPFHALVNIAAPNSSYVLRLDKNYNELLNRKRSSDSRKNIRWRDNKLRAAGNLQFETTFSSEAHHAMLDEMLNHQALRLAESGVADPFGARERAFFHHLIENSHQSHTKVGVRRLSLDGQGLSSILAGEHGRTCTDIITSLAQSPHRKFSPGDLVLRNLISQSCMAGHDVFDLSIGLADYKLQWCDETINLGHIIRAKSVVGLGHAFTHYVEQMIKGLSKKSPVLRNAYFTTRKKLRRVQPATSSDR